jgi:hypothetical protein
MNLIINLWDPVCLFSDFDCHNKILMIDWIWIYILIFETIEFERMLAIHVLFDVVLAFNSGDFSF